MAEPEEQKSPVLATHMHDVRPLATILRGVNDLDSRATFEISKSGLAVSVEDPRTMVARAYIPHEIFNEYKYVPEDTDPPASQDSEQDSEIVTSFQIPLDTLLECLNIFGSATSNIPQSSSENRKKKKKKWKQNSDDEDEFGGGRGRGSRDAVPKDNATLDQYFSNSKEKRTGMRMTYIGTGHPLTLILAEDATGPTTTCEIETMDSSDFCDLPFDDTQKVIKIILRSSWLREAIQELDPSCDKLTFIGTPPSEALPSGSSSSRKGAIKPMLRLTAEGTFGSTQMDYPDDRDVLETFECLELVKFTYRVAHVACALGALKSSLKTSLRIDDEGLLSFQFMMAGDAFIDFRCMPLLDDP